MASSRKCGSAGASPSRPIVAESATETGGQNSYEFCYALVLSTATATEAARSTVTAPISTAGESSARKPAGARSPATRKAAALHHPLAEQLAHLVLILIVATG